MLVVACQSWLKYTVVFKALSITQPPKYLTFQFIGCRQSLCIDNSGQLSVFVFITLIIFI